MRFDHLLQARLLGGDHVIGQDHRKGLVADQVARAPDRVAEAHRLMLPDIGDGTRRHVGRLEHVEQLVLAVLGQARFQFGRMVEVILERPVGIRNVGNAVLRRADQTPVRLQSLRARKQAPHADDGDGGLLGRSVPSR